MEQAAVRWKGVLKEGKGISQRMYMKDTGDNMEVGEGLGGGG